MKYPFNLRAYGILIIDGKILLSHESHQNRKFTKFPGGGVKFGEGLRDCLKREFMEELELSIIVGDHYYTTDFFQQSIFNADEQLISVYYIVSIPDQSFDISTLKSIEKDKTFFWKDLTDLTEADVTFNVDKYVCKLLSHQNK